MLAFIPFIIVGGMIEMALVIGDEEKANADFEKSGRLRVSILIQFVTSSSIEFCYSHRQHRSESLFCLSCIS